MLNYKFMGVVALFGVIAGCWRQFLALFNRLKNVLVLTVDLKNRPVGMAVMYNLKHNYIRVGLTDKDIYSGVYFVNKLRKQYTVAVEGAPNGPVVYYNKKLKHYLLVTHNDNFYLKLTFVRNTLDYEQFISDSIDIYHDSNQLKNNKCNRYYIHNLSGNRGSGQKQRSGGDIDATEDSPPLAGGGSEPCFAEAELKCLNIIRWNVEDLQLSSDTSALDKLSLDDDILMAVEEIKRWNDSEKWYKDKAIPWKRGWLLYGRPGTGKTAFVRAIAQELNMPIMSFDLSSMTNKDLDEKWQYSISRAPAIVLFEDIDAVFNGRKNTTSTEMDRGITFDHLLNTIDGVNNTDGVFLIITTNDIGAIDPALGNIRQGDITDEISTRPGRIDRAVNFPDLDYAGKQKMATRIFDGIDNDRWEDLIDYDKNDTGAQFQERCSRMALSLFWDDHHKK